MSLLQIKKQSMPVATAGAIFNLGFRPFFLGAGVFAVLSVTAWMAIYGFGFTVNTAPISLFHWHAHEMIYGYSMAVIAGFLLTAVMNWTGVQTLHGRGLMVLFSLWAAARLLFYMGSDFLKIAAIADIIFMAGLFVSILLPVLKAKQWGQIGILSKLFILLVGNLTFYLGAFGLIQNGAALGIYAGLYLVIGLILTIGGRVMPMFIKNGIDYEVEVPNPKWIFILSMVLFLLFFINELAFQHSFTSGFLALGLFGVSSWRLIQWHTPGIWRKPLLWGLFFAFISIDIGFLLVALSAFYGLSPFLAVHAFAYGGIGLSTFSMMARVTLGHTGRNIRMPPNLVWCALIALAAGVVVRVGAPLIEPGHYLIWILLSQTLWIGAFLIFIFTFAPMLIRPRIDGEPG